jgi:hypothetical protein
VESGGSAFCCPSQCRQFTSLFETIENCSGKSSIWINVQSADDLPVIEFGNFYSNANSEGLIKNGGEVMTIRNSIFRNNGHLVGAENNPDRIFVFVNCVLDGGLPASHFLSSVSNVLTSTITASWSISFLDTSYCRAIPPRPTSPFPPSSYFVKSLPFSPSATFSPSPSSGFSMSETFVSSAPFRSAAQTPLSGSVTAFPSQSESPQTAPASIPRSETESPTCSVEPAAVGKGQSPGLWVGIVVTLLIIVVSLAAIAVFMVCRRREPTVLKADSITTCELHDEGYAVRFGSEEFSSYDGEEKPKRGWFPLRQRLFSVSGDSETLSDLL